MSPHGRSVIGRRGGSSMQIWAVSRLTMAVLAFVAVYRTPAFLGIGPARQSSPPHPTADLPLRRDVLRSSLATAFAVATSLQDGYDNLAFAFSDDESLKEGSGEASKLNSGAQIRTMSDEEFFRGMKDLTPYQRHILMDGATEPPNSDQKFVNNWPWDTQEPGVYISAVSGKILFSSGAKYDSGFGWPSFTDPIDVSRIAVCYDKKDIVKSPHTQESWRIEVLDKASMTHLGYVYTGGPGSSGKRYILNAGALKFVPGDPQYWDPAAQA